MANRLASATSPYLLQHAQNPVDWWEWSPEAFAEARERDVPILLSVGYAACHWCHVMAHESFEDPATAAQMNAAFVNIKVDREERPDVDSTYMAATQALTGSGGWPMTVFLTPEGQPFYAGTYFPPHPRGGMPSFRELLTAIEQAWTERRDAVTRSASSISRALAGRSITGSGRAPDAATTAAAVRALARDHDAAHGGFGDAPKFPPPMACEFLLRHAAGSGAGEATGRQALDLAASTLRAMAFSGMYDQVAGGFARYAVDRAWVVPHFEKMLYDNALLARVYLHWWRQTGEPLGARIALETCDWMLAELATPEGGLAASLDADTPVDGRAVEGATYVWTPAQLAETLGEADGEWAASAFGVTQAGTFEHGASTLRLLLDVDGAVGDAPPDPRDVERWRQVRARLAKVRGQRPQPARDDKVVAAWNGLAIAALAETGALLDRPDLVAAADRAADLLLSKHLDGAELRRVSRSGLVGTPRGVLEDYANLAEGLHSLYAVTGRPTRFTAAAGLLDAVLTRFADGRGGFHDTPTAELDPPLAAVGRSQDPSDGAHPSGWTAAAGALLHHAALTGSDRHRAAAVAALGVVESLGPQAPRFVGWGLSVAEAALDGPRQVAVVAPRGDPLGDAATRALLHVAWASPAPGLVVAFDAGDALDEPVPLLRDRPPADAGPLAYPCRGFVCDLPTSDPEVLAAALRLDDAAAASALSEQRST